ncbi:MAG: DUF4342 domain-containing protein, partial [Anaerovoracaceae bacterium]|nr:DUF4342 domain-containing protein [Anaerovoracaceae bacterium]
ELINKGNVSKVQVKKDGELILNVPVNAGIVGVMIAPLASVVGVVAAFGFKCTIEVIKTDGTIIDVSDAVTDAMGTVAEKSSDIIGEVKVKSADIYEKSKEKAGEIYEKGKEKAEEVVDKAADKIKLDNDEFDFSECFEEEDDDDEIEIKVEAEEAEEEKDKE